MARLRQRLAAIVLACGRVVVVMAVAPFFAAGLLVALCVQAFLAGWREMRT